MVDDATTVVDASPDWFAAGWRVRAARRLCTSPLGWVALPVVRAIRPRVAADAEWWIERRRTGDRAAWRAQTRQSYSVLLYHRIAGAGEPGQERIDVPPQQFRSQLRVLRLLRFRSLSDTELRHLHEGREVDLGRRRYLLTADDGFADCVGALQRERTEGAWLFVPSSTVGGTANWAQGAPLAAWADLDSVGRAGVSIGSHGRTHTPLVGLDPAALDAELRGSRDDLDAHGHPTDVVAYPNGRHDPEVRAAAHRAGYRLGFTTDNGRNGPATDPLSLRRVTPKAWDSRISFLFRVVTGEALPARWERKRRQAHRARIERRRRQRARTENLAPARRLRLRMARAAVAASTRNGGRVLDAGCQDGLLARDLAAAQPGLRVVGIDLDPEAVASAKDRAQSDGLGNLTLVRGDVTSLPFRDEFDVVMAMECLAEIPDDLAAVRSLAGALRPGGRLMLHVPEAEWTPVLRQSPREWRFGVRHGYDAEALTQMLEEAGLEEIQVTPTSRAVVQLAQELRDRHVRGRGVKMRTLALPFMAAAVRLEEMGLSVGRGRALFAEATRPVGPRGD